LWNAITVSDNISVTTVRLTSTTVWVKINARVTVDVTMTVDDKGEDWDTFSKIGYCKLSLIRKK
jgi:hypothetical protein